LNAFRVLQLKIGLTEFLNQENQVKNRIITRAYEKSQY
jgi:hypothetical protein